MKRVVIVSVWCVLFCVACATTGQEHSPASSHPLADNSPEPQWVKSPCASGIWKARHVICSVGTSYAIKDPALAISTAEAHGRASLAAALKAELSDKWTETAIHTTSPATGKPVEQVDQSRDSEQSVKMALAGARPEERWTSPSGVVNVLMVLDKERFDAAVNRDTLTSSAETKNQPATQAKRPTLDSASR